MDSEKMKRDPGFYWAHYSRVPGRWDIVKISEFGYVYLAGVDGAIGSVTPEVKLPDGFEWGPQILPPEEFLHVHLYKDGRCVCGATNTVHRSDVNQEIVRQLTPGAEGLPVERAKIVDRMRDVCFEIFNSRTSYIRRDTLHRELSELIELDKLAARHDADAKLQRDMLVDRIQKACTPL